MVSRTEILLILAFFIVVGYLSLGAYVLVLRFREPIARVFAAICFSLGGIYLLNFFLFVPSPEFLPQAEFALRLRWAISAVGPALYLHLSAYYFPVSWRKVRERFVFSGYLFALALALLALLGNQFIAGVQVRSTQLAAAVQGPLFAWYWVYFLATFAPSLAGLSVTLWRTRSPLVRRQVLYLLLPQVLIIVLVFVYGNDTHAKQSNLIGDEVGQVLLLIGLGLFARGVLVYGSVVGRPLSARRFLTIVTLFLLIVLLISALLALDMRLNRYASLPIPVFTALLVLLYFVVFHLADEPIKQLIERLAPASSAAITLSGVEPGEQTPTPQDEVERAERFLQVVCQNFAARGGLMVIRQDSRRVAVVASWQMPHVPVGTVADLPPLPIRAPQFITAIFPYVSPDSIWRDMVLVVPLTISGVPGKLFLGEKQNGQLYSHQELEAAAKLPDLYARIEKSAARQTGRVPKGGTPEGPGAFGADLAMNLPEKRETAVSPAMKAPLAIYTLRALTVYRYGQRVTAVEWGSEKAFGMLAYLLWKGQEGATREELSQALWPDKSVAEAANVFHVTLHRLRNVLEPARARGSRYISLEHNRYYLSLDNSVWLDTQEVEKAVAQRDVQALRRAVELFHAGYLEDVAWALPVEAEIERRRYEQLYEQALRILIANLPPREREIYLYRLLQLAPTDQEAHELLLADYLITDRIDLAKSHMEKLRTLSLDEVTKFANP